MSDWKTDMLGNVCDVARGTTITQKQAVAGEIPVVAGGLQPTYFHSVANRPANTITISGSGANAGYVNFYEVPIFASDCSTVRPKNASELDVRFVHYFLKGQQRYISTKLRQGAAQPHVYAKDIAQLAIEFPALTEQQRIVAILDKAFSGLARVTANTETNLKNARELFESYRESIFEAKGKDWIERALGELIDIKHGFAFKSEYFSSDGHYVLLTPGNFFEEGGYRDRGDKQKYYVGEIPRGFVLKKGGFLVAMTEQAPGLIGSSIIVPEDNRFLHNQRLGLVQVKPAVHWSNEFFFHAFNTKRFRKAAHDSASGVKVRHTSPAKLGEIWVSFPELRAVQDNVARRLDDLLEETKRAGQQYERKISQISDLKRSILHKAFSGELPSPSQAIREAAE